ncbi:DUF1461 domain-containing protein [Cocleimonas sp. KMM 6892]|uniref:lipoprotein intramolecular transacylase Lit n=1 Tax=unclassified Cocleimonas TaxID=2639732 RepID=UPI002DBE0071|nr:MULTISPECIES: DUF1461 domain-containing protein [unclassified Cocleimonas]MEB8433685.1 DUF1461 domain-containing protein [Cocleimonas sp. KMM 6892]MEC4716496.1 DUF1461 domain-containing protein [Cocleimonas sp. KMM 6895]MEC4745611.1 DUF1461 domain-containing protein [Cocleimonas sp. KMM 6896]
MKSKSLWAGFLLLTFVITLPVSWGMLAKVNFLYPVLHDVVGIDKHIEIYAPKNRKNKLGFEKTSKEERARLFLGIVDAIHNHGEGLSALSYATSNQQGTTQLTPLLTEPEIVHLKDVAVLLDKIKPLMLVLITVWLFVVIVLKMKKVGMPDAVQFLWSALILIILCGLLLLLGPEKIFNQLHVWAFPDEHQWFFFYEDSLMSTMMKAPVIFAYITGIWIILSIVLTSIILKLFSLPILLGAYKKAHA